MKICYKFITSYPFLFLIVSLCFAPKGLSDDFHSFFDNSSQGKKTRFLEEDMTSATYFTNILRICYLRERQILYHLYVETEKKDTNELIYKIEIDPWT